MKKNLLILLFGLLFFETGFSQTVRFSLATDVSVVRSFKDEQRYWSLGQTITGHFNFSPKDGIYTWFVYYGNGKFSNQLTATAKDTSTIPQQQGYVNHALLRYQHFSTGWKHYLKGASDIENGWSLYAYAGFGLMFGYVENTHSVAIDSAVYSIPVWKGNARFKRLTFDLGLGYEIPVGGDVFFYMEGRVLVPTTDYPSNYLLVNENAPLTGSVSAGLRLLF